MTQTLQRIVRWNLEVTTAVIGAVGGKALDVLFGREEQFQYPITGTQPKHDINYLCYCDCTDDEDVDD